VKLLAGWPAYPPVHYTPLRNKKAPPEGEAQGADFWIRAFGLPYLPTTRAARELSSQISVMAQDDSHQIMLL